MLESQLEELVSKRREREIFGRFLNEQVTRAGAEFSKFYEFLQRNLVFESALVRHSEASGSESSSPTRSMSQSHASDTAETKSSDLLEPGPVDPRTKKRSLGGSSDPKDLHLIKRQNLNQIVTTKLDHSRINPPELPSIQQSPNVSVPPGHPPSIHFGPVAVTHIPFPAPGAIPSQESRPIADISPSQNASIEEEVKHHELPRKKSIPCESFRSSGECESGSQCEYGHFCVRCLANGHTPSICPIRKNVRSRAGKTICISWNASGNCFDPTCTAIHMCLKCRKAFCWEAKHN